MKTIETVNRDLYRITGEDSFNMLLKTFLNNGSFRFLFIHRFYNYFSKYNIIKIFLLICYNVLKIKYGFQIPLKTKIAEGFVINHFGNIVINQGVVIGSDCTISQGITIGKTSRGNNQGNPIIGDRVWIGANAVIAGKIKIGNDVLIAPLSYVNFDIPDNAVVMGNPAKIINYNGSNGYIKNS